MVYNLWIKHNLSIQKYFTWVTYNQFKAQKKPYNFKAEIINILVTPVTFIQQMNNRDRYLI